MQIDFLPFFGILAIVLILGFILGYITKPEKQTSNFSITRTEQELKQINESLAKLVSIQRQKLGM